MRHKRLPLQWENALEGVSEELYDEVEPCSFPSLQLRFRNDRFLGGNNRNDDDNISDEKLVRYFGGWEVCDASDRRLDGGNHKFLALRYHGYQFGHYNEDIGDDRGFLIGQIRAADGKVHLSLDGVDARQSVGKAASCEYYMNITGEAFDCGPFAFMEFYNPRFTAAYFDMEGRCSFQNQKKACHWNLEMLQYPFSMFVERTEPEKALEGSYDTTF